MIKSLILVFSTLAWVAIFIVGSLVQTGLSAQGTGFTTDLVLGANLSQLDGDGLGGFEKFGPRAGLRISWPISEQWSMSSDILYEGRGSASQLVGGGSSRTYIDLDYIAIPISIHYSSWFDGEWRRHRVHLIGSITPARLISTSSTHANFNQAVDRFTKWDVSLRLAVQYAMGRRSSVELGLERSLVKIYRPVGADFNALQSYQVNIAYHYHLQSGL